MTCSTIFICIVVASTIITESNESQAMPNRTRRPQTHHLDRIALHSFSSPLDPLPYDLRDRILPLPRTEAVRLTANGTSIVLSKRCVPRLPLIPVLGQLK